MLNRQTTGVCWRIRISTSDTLKFCNNITILASRECPLILSFKLSNGTKLYPRNQFRCCSNQQQQQTRRPLRETNNNNKFRSAGTLTARVKLTLRQGVPQLILSLYLNM